MTDTRNTTNPLVSVVIPSYDRPAYLERAMESVLGQTYSNIELIVVDDCSPTDLSGTVEAIDISPLAGFEFIQHNTNQGGSAARNTGIEAANGEFIAFLDDDDRWEPNKIEKQVAAFQSSGPSVGVVYTGVRQVDSDGQTKAVKTPQIEGAVTNRLLKGNFIGTFSAVMVRADVVDTTGTLDERFPSWQDWEYYIRLSEDWEFSSIPEPLVIRESGDQEQVSDDLKTKRNVTQRIFREKFDRLAAERHMEDEFRATVAFYMVKSAIANREYDYARRMALRAVSLQPLEPKHLLYLLLLSGGRYTLEPVRNLKRMVVRAT